MDQRNEFGPARRLEPTAEARAWVADVMTRVEDGSIWREVAEQPSVEEMVDDWRRTRAS
jgi:hypothetical protein